MAPETAEYRVYTLDGANRIIGCEEVDCSDDRQAFILSTTLGKAGFELEIWQKQRFVGRLTRQPAPGSVPHRVLTSIVGHRLADDGPGPHRGIPDPA